jgi:hypothetical protein
MSIWGTTKVNGHLPSDSHDFCMRMQAVNVLAFSIIRSIGYKMDKKYFNDLLYYGDPEGV